MITPASFGYALSQCLFVALLQALIPGLVGAIGVSAVAGAAQTVVAQTVVVDFKTGPPLNTTPVTDEYLATKDPFSDASPSFDRAPEASTNYNTGESGVAEQRGAATYTFPIRLPQGRNGMAPSLTLRYSSHSPLRGGLAVGWLLDVPSVKVDRAVGVEQEPVFQGAVGKASGRLIRVPDKNPFGGDAYRIDFDDSFTRFFHVRPNDPLQDHWIALTADGLKHFFGNQRFSGDGETEWLMTRQVDPFGNAVQYFRERVTSGRYVEDALKRIEYASNTTAGLPAYAKVEFIYAPLDLCPNSTMPIGAGANGPNRINHARRMTEIRVSVRDEPSSEFRLSQRISLTYELRASTLSQLVLTDGTSGDRCSQNRLRYLAQIQVTAFDRQGAPVKTPPTKFDYNARRNVNTATPQPCLGPGPCNPDRSIATPAHGHYGTLTGAVGDRFDIDGDGLPELASVQEQNDICTLVWQRGRPGGTFEDVVHRSPLPTARWHRPRLGAERCTLNGQTVAWDRSIQGGKQAELAVLSYHFMDYTGDGRLDLLTSVWAGGNHEDIQPQSLLEEPPAGGPTGLSKDLEGSGVPPLQLQPQNEAHERFVWRVYRNSKEFTFQDPPDAVFSFRALKVTSPKPLPFNISDEHLDRSTIPSSILPVLFDLDGDGFLDVIDIGSHPNLIGKDRTGCDGIDDAAPSWCVHFGNGGAGFAKGREWRVPEVVLSTDNGGQPIERGDRIHKRQRTVAVLRDINGDGLADLVVRIRTGALKAYLSTGSRFDGQPIDLGKNLALEELQTSYSSACSLATVCDGDRGYRRRLVDVDGDGLLDILSFLGPEDDIATTSAISASFNVGDGFSPAVSLVGTSWARAKRLFAASKRDWWIRSDFVDIDGDGLEDLARWSDNKQALSYLESPGLPEAPDLLRRIESGRGAVAEFSYTTSTDQRVVTSGDNSYLPAPLWVVRQVTTNGGFRTPKMVQRYTYAAPFQASAREHTGLPEVHRFLGFKTVTVVDHGAHDARLSRVVRVYSFAAPEGRVAQQSTAIWVNGSFRLHGFEETEWKRHPLFAGQLSVVYPEFTHVRTCSSGSSDAACRTQSTNVHRTRSVWTPVKPSAMVGGKLPHSFPGVSAPEMYLLKETTWGSGLSSDAGDRRKRFGYQVRYGQSGFATDDYRILPTSEVLEEAQASSGGSVFDKRGETNTQYAPATGLRVVTEERFDPNTVAKTKRTFDSRTGNLLSVTKPMQTSAGGSGRNAVLIYDKHKLFVAEAVNELGHKLFTHTDVATGVVLERRGPSSVKIGTNQTVFEQEIWKIDGFGRILEHSVSIDHPTNGYVGMRIERSTYFDQEQPSRIRIEHRRDVLNDDVQIVTERTMDGLGRVLTTTQLTGGPGNAVTAYRYDSRGSLAAITAPDPRTDDGSTVRYDYSYDGLGRLTTFKRPDATGVAIAYDGLGKTVRELTADGSGGSKKQIVDVFGRLVEVHELYPDTGPGITRYGYDAHDNLSAITDADGNFTTLTHDWARHRTSIRRGGGVWRYTYDLNGNLSSRLVPAPIGGNPALYTTSYRYDDLDRVATATYADIRVGSLQAPLPQPAARTWANTHYTYDDGANGLGRLSRVDLPFGRIRYTYDARGLITNEERSFTLSGIALANVSKRVRREYNALGQVTRSEWDDGQQWHVTYDARGLVDAVQWLDPQTRTLRQVADYKRSLIGLPRNRASAFGQTRQHSYDMLGRPIQDRVTVAGSSKPLATRSYKYTGSGDLASVTGMTRDVTAAATYSYDAQHRLTSATGPNGYLGAFTYSPTGNILTADITWNGSPDTRKVRYEYNAADPQAVDRLVNIDGATSFASFQYDPAGNMTQRAAPQGETSLQWDGLDRLRVAQAPGGSEVYFYDHTGARMLAVNQANGVRFWFAESETRYDLTGTTTKRYLHLGISGPTLARVEDGNKIELQYADALQNLMFSTDATGKVTASFLYGAFGEAVQAAGGADHRRQFNGKESDAASGLRYYGYRYYDPLVLRWNSADPLYRFVPEVGSAAPQRQNLYSFSNNNPARYYDPDGRQAFGVHGGTAENPCPVEPPLGYCEKGGGDTDSPQDDAEPKEDTEPQQDTACDTENASCTEAQSETTESEAVAAIAAGSGGLVNWLLRKSREIIAAATFGHDVQLEMIKGRKWEVVSRKEIRDKAAAKEATKPRGSSKLRASAGGASKLLNVLGWIGAIAVDVETMIRAQQSGRSFGDQMREESKDSKTIIILPFFLPIPNPDYCPGCPPGCSRTHCPS